MNRTTALIAAIALYAAGCAYALFTVSMKGEWPATWPKELEPLRKQALLEGLDAIGATLKNAAAIAAFQQRQRAERPWVWQA